MEILNLRYSKKAIVFNENELEEGWNTLNVNDIFQLPPLTHNIQNTTLKVTLLIKCLFECEIQILNSDEESVYTRSNEMIVSNTPSKKPILSVNLGQDLDIPDNDLQKKDLRSRVSRQLGTNYSPTDYSSNLCKNNYPNAVRECCLITYFVDFNALKWSWILSPSGFLANYCNGKCNEKKSFKYASKYSQNAEVKLTYNEKFLTGDYETGEMMETCCHPVSMDSLVIKYIANNGSIISKVLPNMIITGCGCS